MTDKKPHPMLTPEFGEEMRKKAAEIPDKPPLNKHNLPGRIPNKPRPEPDAPETDKPESN